MCARQLSRHHCRFFVFLSSLLTTVALGLLLCMCTIWKVISFRASKLWFSWFFLSHFWSILVSPPWKYMERKKQSQSPLKLKQMELTPQLSLFQSFMEPKEQMEISTGPIHMGYFQFGWALWKHQDARYATLHEEWHLWIPRFYTRDVFWFPLKECIYFKTIW